MRGKTLKLLKCYMTRVIWLLICFDFSPKLAFSASTVEDQLKELFLQTVTPSMTKDAKGALKRSGSCTTVSRGPKTGLRDKVSAADAAIEVVMAAINAENLTTVIPLFHPRLNVSEKQIAEALNDLRRTLGSPVKASIFRTWLFDTVDGSPLDLDCDGGEFRVSTHYGYDLSLGIWLQVLGKGELGRLYFSLVPKDGKFLIGAWHLHQWSHIGLDSVAWQDKVSKFSTVLERPSAFLLQDIALKLLDQKVFVVPQAVIAVQQKRDQIMAQGDWEKVATETARRLDPSEQTGNAAAAPDITAIRTALAQDGAGINFYARVPGDISARDFESRCIAIARKFFSSSSWKAVDGVKCHFVLPAEPADKEGKLGGQYFGRQAAAAYVAPKASPGK